MNQLGKYIAGIAGALIIMFLAWIFADILIYILISAILSLIGKPLMSHISSIKIKGHSININLSASITLIVILGLFFSFFFFVAPLVGDLIGSVRSMDMNTLNEKIGIPLSTFNNYLLETFPGLTAEFKIENIIFNEFKNLINAETITNFFTSITSFVFDFAIGVFIVSFITFFFLKEKDMFSNMVLALFPDKYETNVKRALNSVFNLLARYFIGISLETVLITLLNGLGLYFIGGVHFSLAIVLGLISGILNVIPYIGPWLGGIIGVLISMTEIGLNIPDAGMVIITLALIFFITHMIDVFLFQPYIYSNSVQAHPLEIFIVILIAASIGGIIGMLVAIPAYTVIRVFAKEFFSNFKLVQKLTEKIE
jgi:predicted PurR-regulated permease PerM